MRLLLLALEFLAVFAGLPLLIYFRRLPNLPIPYLLVVGLIAFLLLRADHAFPIAQLTCWGNYRPFLTTILIRDVICLLFLSLSVYLFAPALLFSLLKRSPLLWLAIVILYPLVSVYPQELFYRAFFFHRYQPLFGSGWGMIVASSLAFGFVHIIFRNWIAVALCVIGGLLFSWTYQTSGSLLLAGLDHTIFGDFIFTIGLGQFFFHGFRA